MILESKNLYCGYNGSDVLKDISLSFKSDEIVSIIGPNGAGKTTLLRALTRILKPRQGAISLDGRNISDIPAKDFSRTVAVVTQGAVPENQRLEDYVLMGRIPHYGRFQLTETPHDIEVVRRCLKETDSLALADRQLGKISMGQRQLARIALALAQEPKLLLLDEPTSHLDITHQSIILNLVRRLNRELGLGVIMVMHDLNLASEFSDKLVLMEDGKVRICASAQEVIVPELISSVYRTRTVTGKNPASSKPHIFISAQEDDA